MPFRSFVCVLSAVCSFEVFAITKDEMINKSEIVCESDLVIIGFNKTENEAWHYEKRKDEVWVILVKNVAQTDGKAEWDLSLKGQLLLLNKELPVPVPMIFETKLDFGWIPADIDGTWITLNYSFGVNKPTQLLPTMYCELTKKK